MSKYNSDKAAPVPIRIEQKPYAEHLAPPPAQTVDIWGAIKTYPSRYAYTKSRANSLLSRKYVGSRQYLRIYTEKAFLGASSLKRLRSLCDPIVLPFLGFAVCV